MEKKDPTSEKPNPTQFEMSVETVRVVLRTERRFHSLKEEQEFLRRFLIPAKILFFFMKLEFSLPSLLKNTTPWESCKNNQVLQIIILKKRPKKNHWKTTKSIYLSLVHWSLISYSKPANDEFYYRKMYRIEFFKFILLIRSFVQIIYFLVLLSTDMIKIESLDRLVEYKLFTKRRSRIIYKGHDI